MFNERIKPPLVLTLICIITCGLLVAAYQATYVDNTGVITDELKSGLTELYGSADGFEMLKNADGSVVTYEGVDSVISNGENTAFEVTADGYSTDGIHVLIGIDQSGSVSGISILSLGETPGLGSRVQEESFLNQFRGVTKEMTVAEEGGEPIKAKAVWGTRKRINELEFDKEISGGSGSGFALDAISGATFSSRGMYSAVRTALNAYGEMKGAEDNG